MILIISFPARADLLVITHEDSEVETLSRVEVQGLWLKDFSTVNNVEIRVIDVNESNALRNTFYQNVLGMSDRKVKAYWAIKVFRGEGLPPSMLDGEVQVKEWVVAGLNRLGYIEADKVESPFKVVYRHPLDQEQDD